MPTPKIHISIEPNGFGLRLQYPNASEYITKYLSLAQLVRLIEILEKARDAKVESVLVGSVE